MLRFLEANTKKRRCISKTTSFKDFVGEKIKIAAKYWAHTNTKILYALIAEKRLKNLSVTYFAF